MIFGVLFGWGGLRSTSFFIGEVVGKVVDEVLIRSLVGEIEGVMIKIHHVGQIRRVNSPR